MKKLYPALIPLFILVIVFLVHFRYSPMIVSSDSRLTIPTAISLLKQGNTQIEAYTDPLEKTNPGLPIEKLDGHSYNLYPVGPSLLALPFVFVLDKLNYPIIERYQKVELLVASFIVALTAVFIYLLVRLYLEVEWSLLLTFTFAFGTSAWSTASRGLWQHGPSMLMLTLALYLLLLARARPALVQFASLPLAFAYVCRPTNSLSLALLSLFVLLQYRRYFGRYLFWSLPVAVPFLAFNLAVYHQPLSQYYRGTVGAGWSLATFWEALPGTLLSPSRGLFIFTPVLLFSLWGVWLKFRQRQLDLLDLALVAILVLHWLTVSLWVIWWAGHSYGPRIFTDVLPYFIYFLIPVGQSLPKLPGRMRYILAGLFLIALALSCFIHYRGASTFAVYTWNFDPPINEHLRVWNWRDPQFLRGLK